MPEAGFCAECGKNTWVAPNGECCEGHSPASVSNTYEAQPVGLPDAGRQSKVAQALFIGAVVAASIWAMIAVIYHPYYLAGNLGAYLFSALISIYWPIAIGLAFAAKSKGHDGAVRVVTWILGAALALGIVVVAVGG